MHVNAQRLHGEPTLLACLCMCLEEKLRGRWNCFFFELVSGRRKFERGIQVRTSFMFCFCGMRVQNTKCLI